MRLALLTGVVALLLPGTAAHAVYMTSDQDFTASSTGYWQGLFYEYTYGTTTVSPVRVGRADISAPWLLYSSWYGLFLYDYSTARYEEAFYYRDERL